MTIKNGDIPTMQTPIIETWITANGTESTYGLTKREMFAMHAMSAWIIHHGSSGSYGFSDSDAAAIAVKCADELLKELGK